ncbi:transposable element tcb1 transposase [Trichonephila clavipes]|uniref:Transposable element tcb1 transposase n=1 Tax=Trichonephila clavipes TaxID=2585209 RepID=A0A8X6WF12_TRICX|nr:transposable element tcb1 transposase [Trichonephila clavipes]
MIKKEDVSDDCQNVLRPGTPVKLRDRDRRMLSKAIRKGRTQPMAHILQEFQQVSGPVVLINTIRKKTHFLCFYGRAAIHIPLVTKFNRAARLSW